MNNRKFEYSKLALLKNEYFLKIVGEKDFQDNLLQLIKNSNKIGDSEIEMIATLYLESDIPGGIVVVIEGLIVGYVPENQAKQFFRVFNHLKTQDRILACWVRLKNCDYHGYKNNLNITVELGINKYLHLKNQNPEVLAPIESYDVKGVGEVQEYLLELMENAQCEYLDLLVELVAPLEESNSTNIVVWAEGKQIGILSSLSLLPLIKELRYLKSKSKIKAKAILYWQEANRISVLVYLPVPNHE